MKQSLTVNDANIEISGTQDAGGWGLFGICAGVVVGFFIAYLFGVPLFPKGPATLNLVLITSLVTAAMAIGGGIGYVATRRRQ